MSGVQRDPGQAVDQFSKLFVAHAAGYRIDTGVARLLEVNFGNATSCKECNF
jgi:hypothetical protein